MGVFKTPDSNCVKAVVGSMVAAATVSVGRNDIDVNDSGANMCIFGVSEDLEEKMVCWVIREEGAKADTD